MADTPKDNSQSEDAPPPELGSRIPARFKDIGLDEDIPELRGEEAKPADLDKDCASPAHAALLALRLQHHILGSLRSAQQVSLAMVAAGCGDGLALLLGLYALGEDFQAEAVAKVGHGAQDGLVAFAFGDVDHESAVDLQL